MTPCAVKHRAERWLRERVVGWVTPIVRDMVATAHPPRPHVVNDLGADLEEMPDLLGLAEARCVATLAMVAEFLEGWAGDPDDEDDRAAAWALCEELRFQFTVDEQIEGWIRR